MGFTIGVAAKQGDADQPDVQAIDQLVLQLVPRATKGNPAAIEGIRWLLGLAEARAGRVPSRWPTSTEVAEALGVSRQRGTQLAQKGRERWSRLPSVTRLRGDVATLLSTAGGVMEIGELAAALLAARGSATDEPARTAGAVACVRAASETELATAAPRWAQRRHGDVVLLALDDVESEVTAADLLAWAVRLGDAADRLASTEPLPGPSAVLTALRTIPPPEGMAPISETRLVALSAAASSTAAASSRLEVYPRGLEAARALRLAQSALVGAQALRPEDIAERIRSRYPASAALPKGDALAALLQEASIELRWDSAARDGEGAYVPKDIRGAGLTSTTSLAPRIQTASPPIVADDEAADVERRLAAAARTGGFLVLTVEPRLYEAAASELRRFGVTRVSVEELLLRHLHRRAEEAGAAWEVVVAADGAGSDSRDWTRLLSLVRSTIPAVEADLAAAGQMVLVTESGPLARYGAMAVLERLRDRAGDPSGPHAAWLVIPADTTKELPMVDGEAVSVLSDSQWARLPERWVLNAHRAAPSPVGARS
jgi:hypothetical protein